MIIETDAYEEKTHKTVIRDQADIDEFFGSFKSCESSEEEKPMMVGTLEVIFVTRNRDETSYPRFNVSPTLGQLGYSFTPYFRDTPFIGLGEYKCKNASDFLERKAPWRF